MSVLERKEHEKLRDEPTNENDTVNSDPTSNENQPTNQNDPINENGPVYAKEVGEQNEEGTQREKEQEEKFDHLSEPVNAFHGKCRLILLCGCTSMGSALFGYNQAIFGTLFQPLGIHDSFFVFQMRF